MNAKLLTDKRYPAGWVTNFAPIPAGTIVPVVPATNIPQNGDAIRYWIDTAELRDDPYGIGLYDGEFELVTEVNARLVIVRKGGERMIIDPDGRITTANWKGSADWIFLGFSTHHWHNRITVPLADVFANPDVIKGKKLYGWDRDHGTLRSWASPGISSAYIES